MAYIHNALTQTHDNASQNSGGSNFIVLLYDRPVLGSRLYRYNKCTMHSQRYLKGDPRKKHFFAARSWRDVRLTGGAHYYKHDGSQKLPRFFLPYRSPSLLYFNHPSFSRGDLLFLDLVEFGTPYSWIGSQVGVGRRWLHSVVPVRR